MQARFRSDYAGEFVVIESRWSGGKKTQTREWIANPIENHHISGRAACIGSTTDLGSFDYTKLQRHRGGLLSSKKLQTYGTGNIAQTMRLDFAVETNFQNLDVIKNSGYAEKNIVYTTSKNCINNPGEFYLVPLFPRILDIALLLYLAAFDGHKEIFLLGYNRDTGVEHLNWQDQIRSVVDAYSGTKFFFVGESTNMFDCWLEPTNTQTMTYRDFITYCDV
jgi:hypothetical protein